MRIGKKYLLQPAEEKRWLQLVTLECSDKATPEQMVELEKLQRKRMRLLNRHPRMKVANRARRNADRRLSRLLAKVDAQLKKLGIEGGFSDCVKKKKKNS